MDREKASQSFLGAPGLTTRRMRIYPVEGDQNTEQTILMTGPPPTRDRRGKEDRRRPGQRQVPPRQGPDRPLRPRPGPGRITPIYLPPYAPDLGSHGTRTGRRQEPAPPTPARSPQRKPSRPSPPTSPTAPSTTTSSTSQPHHHTPILFNSSHSSSPTPAALPPVLPQVQSSSGPGAASGCHQMSPPACLPYSSAASSHSTRLRCSTPSRLRLRGSRLRTSFGWLSGTARRASNSRRRVLSLARR